MSAMKKILETVSRTQGCRVLPAEGMPVLRAGESLPLDLAAFYSLCGGVSLFAEAEYPVSVVSPKQFVRANPAIAGVEIADDISDFWYVVASGGAEESITIDCHPSRLGRCYDSFWDRHGVPGSQNIVALSFSELLRRLVAARGGHWYWLEESGSGHGDAYDQA